jgi:hypothetical protein
MNLIHRFLLTAIILTQSFCLYAQQNPLHAYLPADAKTIININLPSLASKMKWQEIQQLSFFEEALKDAPLHLQEVLKDPASTGINFQSDLFIVLLPDPKNKTKSIPVLYGQLSDSAKFATTVQKISPKQKINTVGKLKILADNKNVFAWTSRLFVAPMSKDKYLAPSLSKSEKNAQNTKAVATLTNQLIKQCQLLLTPVANPVTNDSRFIDLTKEDGDMRLWLNRNMEKPKGKANKKDGVLKMMNWGIMQQGNYMAGVLRFENGKAVMQMKSYMNKTMDSLYRLYPSENLNSGLLKKLPSGQLIALISFSMSPKMLGAIMKASGAEKMVDSLTKKSSVKPMEVAEGLNGDVTLAVIRAQEYDEKDTVTAALNGLQLFLAASVKNKSKIEPLVNILQKPKEIKRDAEGNEIKPSGPLAGLKPTFLLTDSFFVASISPFAAEKFLNTNSNSVITELTAPYVSHPSLFSLDINAIANFAMQMSKKKKKDDGQEGSKIFEAFERVVFYGGKYENGAALSTAELQFSNKEENSLKQFIKLIEMGIKMEMNKKSKSSYNEDAQAPTEELSEETKIEVIEEPAPPPPPKQKTKKDN